MKKVLSFLLVLCLLVGTCAVALAASKPSISSQPESQTVKAGGSATIKIKAKNFTALTWYFVDPENGNKISARHIAEKFKGLRVQNPNGQSLTLKKIPAEMHGWSLYCHLVGNGHQVDSDTIMILIKGMEPPADMPAPAAPQEGEEDEEAPAPGEDGEGAEDAEGEETVTRPNGPFTVTVTGDLQLFELSRSGKPTGDPQTSLRFEDEASFYVKANGYIQYLLINDIQLTPASNVSGMTIRGIAKDTTIQGRVIKAEGAGEEEEFNAAAEETGDEPAEAPAEEDFSMEGAAESNENEAAEETEAAGDEAEEETGDEGDTYVPEYVPTVAASPTPAPEIPSDTTGMVLVTCERCRFSGGGNSFATSGYVPVGTVITVVCGSEGNLASGYSINGAAGTNKGQASFKLTVDADTTIKMQQR